MDFSDAVWGGENDAVFKKFEIWFQEIEMLRAPPFQK
jgi:hypothetical protein